MGRWRSVGGPLAAAVLGLAVGLVAGGRPSAWYDEAATVAAVDRAPAQLMHVLGHIDVVHATYYVAAMGWAALFGDTVVSLRAFGSVGLAVACALVVVLARRFLPSQAALTAGLATALTPGIAWSGVEARSYSWSVAGAVLAMIAFTAAVDRPGLLRWGLYSLATALAGWVFLYTALMVPAQAGALWSARRRARGFLPAAGAGVALLAPLGWLAAHQQGQVDWIHITPRELLARVTVNQVFGGAPAPESLPRPLRIVAVVLGLVATALAAYGVWRSRTGDDDRRLLGHLCVWWTVLPTLLLGGATLAGKELYQERYLAFTVPAFTLAVVLGLLELASLRRYVVAAALVALAVPLVAHQHTGHSKHDDYRRLATAVARSHADATVETTAGARGIAVAYPAAFTGVRDLDLEQDGRASGTIFGRSAPAGLIDAASVRGLTVALIHKSDVSVRHDGYFMRLLQLGCRVGSSSRDIRFTVTVLHC